MRNVLLLLFLLAVSLASQCQVRMAGIVRTNDGQPLESATVLLHRHKDSILIRSAMTASTGQFQFRRLSPGTYFLSVTSVGYEGYASGVVQLDSGTSREMVVVLHPTAKDLRTVSVTKKRPFLEWKLDKMVVNVESSPFFTPGMSALEILERSPGIEVDYVRNTIGLITRPGTTIFINGRRSYFSGADLLNYLRGLPAGSIEQVEIMSQPSAKYDADNVGGVINIVLKRNQADGLTGSVTASGVFGYYFKTRDNLMLNWRQDKVNLNFTMGISDNKTYNDQHTQTSFRNAYGLPFYQYQDFQTSMITDSRAYTPHLAMDIQVSKSSSLGVGLQGLFSTNRSSAGGWVDLLDSLGNLVRRQPVPSVSRNTVSSPGVNVNWLQKWGGGRELTADADYVRYHSPVTQDSYFLTGSLPSDIDIYAFKVDYSQPLGKVGGGRDTKLEAGIKTSYVRTDNSSSYQQYDTVGKSWQQDVAFNNHFIYTEGINAGYVNVSRQFNKIWSAQLGIRGEQTVADGNELVQGESFRHRYFNMFPSAYLGFVPNEKHSFSVSYGGGIGRPRYPDLNPFRYVINQYNVRQGNPGLQPDHTHLIQFEYHYQPAFYVGLYWFRGSNLQARVYHTTGQGDSLITVLTRENVAFRRNVFLVLGFNKGLTKWWNANWQVVFIDARLGDPANIGYPVDNLRGAKLVLNNQFPLGKGWSLDLRGNYFTRWMEGIRIYGVPLWNNSVGVNKKMLNDKATLTVNLNDPFYVYRPGQTADATAFFTRTDDRPENRYLTVTWNYRFGKAKQQQRKHDGGSADEEQQRAKF